MIGSKSFYDDKTRYINFFPNNSFYPSLFIGTMFLLIFVFLFFLGKKVYDQSQTTQSQTTQSQTTQSQTTQNQTTQSQTLQICPESQCATSIATGIKRCPKKGSSIVYNPGKEVCSQAESCTNIELPYAYLSNGETDVNGICDPGVQCRCLSFPTCPFHTTTIFEISGGSAFAEEPSLANYIIDLIPSVSDDIAQITIEKPDVQYCKINPGFLNRTTPECDVQDTLYPLNSINKCVAQNPCPIGQLASIVDNKDSLQFCQYDPVRNNLSNYFRDPRFYTVGCYTGETCISETPSSDRFFPVVDAFLSQISYVQYIVKAGETLDSIAKKFSVDFQTLKNANLENISQGTLLYIPSTQSMYYPVWNSSINKVECIMCRPFLSAQPRIIQAKVGSIFSNIYEKGISSGQRDNIIFYDGPTTDWNFSFNKVWVYQMKSNPRTIKVNGRNLNSTLTMSSKSGVLNLTDSYLYFDIIISQFVNSKNTSFTVSFLLKTASNTKVLYSLNIMNLLNINKITGSQTIRIPMKNISGKDFNTIEFNVKSGNNILNFELLGTIRISSIYSGEIYSGKDFSNYTRVPGNVTSVYDGSEFWFNGDISLPENELKVELTGIGNAGSGATVSVGSIDTDGRISSINVVNSGSNYNENEFYDVVLTQYKYPYE